MIRRDSSICSKMCCGFQMDQNNVVRQISSSNSLSPGVYYPSNKMKLRFRKKSPRIKTERAVTKTGEFNVEKPGPNQLEYLCNWFIVIVDARWRWTLLNFFMAFTADWLFFGFIYWIIVWCHGDLIEEHLPHRQNMTKFTPCIENIYGFTSSFLFSIEVHTTVAYGHRSITLECPDAIIAMCLQCIISSIFQAFMVGILFAKLTRPKARTQTILFSRTAVVNYRDDKLCMFFRVGDMRKSRILNIKALAYLIKFDPVSDNPEEYTQTELKVEIADCESFFFLWPVSCIHVIDENSPFHKISAADLLCDKFEILVVFEGMIESTGQPVQARSSFTENEILWGHRFVKMVQYDKMESKYVVDFSKLSETEDVDIPLCSAWEYDSVMESFTFQTQSSQSNSF